MTRRSTKNYVRFCFGGRIGKNDGRQFNNSRRSRRINMMRSIVALALVSVSLGASAAEKPLPVTVTNDVVPVEVSNADPIPVTDSGKAVEPGYTPYQQFEFFNQGPTYCTQFVCTIMFDAVPAGMRLVVTHLMGFFSMSAPVSSPYVAVGVDGSSSTRLPIPVTVQPAAGSNFAASSPVTYFVEAGQRPTVFVGGDNVRDVSRTAQVGLAGYLVKL